MSRSRFVGLPRSWMIAPLLLLFLVGTPVAADERPMRPSEGQDDARLREGQLRHEELRGAGRRDEEIEERFQAHLEAARRFVDVQAYDTALTEIEAANRLIPFHEEAMLLLELIGDMRDGAREAEMALSPAEERRRAQEVRATLEREAAERQERAAEEVIERRGLPGDVQTALGALLARQDELREGIEQARRDRERCIGAAARVHAHGAGRQCGEEERRLEEVRGRQSALESDLAILTEAVRERHGQEALDRILDGDED